MLRKTLDKKSYGKLCNNTIFGEQIFPEHVRGQIDELVWGFLRKNMKIYPHRHPQKEVYIFLSGCGMMQVGNEEFAVSKGDIIYIEPNKLHTAWNNHDEDLEFIIVKAENLTIRAALAATFFGK